MCHAQFVLNVYVTDNRYQCFAANRSHSYLRRSSRSNEQRNAFFFVLLTTLIVFFLKKLKFMKTLSLLVLQQPETTKLSC